MPWKVKQEVIVSFFFSLTRVCTMETKKPIISPSRTDTNSIISPGLIIDFVSVREKACYHGYGSVLNNL